MRQGKKFEFAHGAVVLHPLTLGQLQDYEDDLKSLGETATQTQQNARLAKIIAAAAQKSTPDLGERAVLEMIDMQDLNGGLLSQAVQWVMGASGLRETKEGSVKADPLPPVPETVPAILSPGDNATPGSP
jgi:hypothetical protein